MAAACLLTLPLVTPKIRGADEIEYFSYLPSLVMDRDLDFENEYRRFHERDPEGLAGFKSTFLDRREPLTGRPTNFGPIGSALLWSPFYLLAHAGTKLASAAGMGVAADGFSLPYAAAACYASWLYGALGLLLTHDALRRFLAVPDPEAALAVIALLWGSPLLYYMTLAPAFSHATSVFAVALLLWATLRLRETVRLLPWLGLGLLAGLAALVREQDALFAVIPAGLVVTGAVRAAAAGPASERVRVLLRAATRLALLGAGAVAAFLPQLLAYRAINGTFGPSTLVTRKMSYDSPHFLEVLIDPGHGLFAWSPLLALAAAGLVLLCLRRRDALSLVLAASFFLQVWINGAVESWTQAGAFGSRRFVGATAIFACGLAATLLALRPRLGARGLATCLALFAWWNVSLMVQFGLRLMDRQRLEWPRVAMNQVAAVPPRLGRAAWLFLTDRERLLREAP